MCSLGSTQARRDSAESRFGKIMNHAQQDAGHTFQPRMPQVLGLFLLGSGMLFKVGILRAALVVFVLGSGSAAAKAQEQVQCSTSNVQTRCSNTQIDNVVMVVNHYK
jgi:hypothetical protein